MHLQRGKQINMKPIEGRRKNLQRNENNERRENDTLNWRSGNECDTRLTASTRDALTVDCLTRWLQLAMRLVAGAIWNLKRIAGGDIGNVAWISVALTLQVCVSVCVCMYVVGVALFCMCPHVCGFI